MRSSSIAVLGSVVLALAAASSASAQIVTNGGFETGDFTGWTGVGNNGFQGVSTGAAHSGTFGAFFGPVGSTGGIDQTIATTAGDTYTFSFWLQGDGDQTNSFEADWNGTSVFSLSDAAGQPYTLESFTTTATASSTAIQFLFRDDPGYWDFDDVSGVVDDGPGGGNLSVTPEPATMGLLATGLVGIAGFGRRRRKDAK